jgi:hypothetical protein
MTLPPFGLAIMAILHPSHPDEKASALRQAALAPTLFAELAEQFPGGQVSDDNLRSCLMRKGFSSGSLAGVISAFRETMQMVSLEEEKTPVMPALPAPQSVPTTHVRQPPLMHTATATNPTLPPPAWVVSTDGRVLTVNAQLDNAKAVDKLILVLQANKLLLPEADESAKQQASGNDDSTH